MKEGTSTSTTLEALVASRTAYICRENTPAGRTAGYDIEGNVTISRNPESYAFFATPAEARAFIELHLPGGSRNWGIESL